MKPEFREAFSSLQTIEGRLDFIEREHAKHSSTKNSEVSGRDEAGPLRRHRLNFESTRVEQLREE
ncbi:hypothetical protein EJB05_57405, partial [Eragrostis curvula]